MDIDRIINDMTLEEKASLCSGSDFWRTQAVERLGIPRVMMCDATHGLRKQGGEADHLGINESIPAVCFPTASALASSFDRELLYLIGETLGEDCQAENIAMLLGPGLNIKRSPLCGRNFEYFSEDPYLAGELGAAYVRGLQEKGIAACCKHFAANNQETRRLTSSSEVDERTLHEIYLPAFETVVKKAKVRSVMCSYNRLNGIYASEHKELLTDILRERWGFDGFVVTDWGAVKDRVMGLEAGLDLEMPGCPGNQDAKIVAAVQSGRLKETVLDTTVRRLLMFVKDYSENRKEDTVFNREQDHRLSGDIAAECAVLMKNEAGVLPLLKTETVAFIGGFAKTPRFQGSGSSHVNAAKVASAMEAAQGLSVLYAQGYPAKADETDDGLIEEAVRIARKANAAVLFVGLPPSYETEGIDRRSLALPESQNRLIRAVAAVQPKTAVVLHGGAPVEMPWISEVPAILNMYLGGDNVGSATVKLLYGDVNPSGKLAETWPLKLADNPSFLNFPDENNLVHYREGIYVGYRYYDKKQINVLFPFGHGLSYSAFTYSSLQLDKTSMSDTEVLTVSCKVKNTGNRIGKEAVQLYVCDQQSTYGRPVRELKCFEKLTLNPDEEKEVVFILDKRAFAYFDPEVHDWIVESGFFTVEIGASSRDIRLHARIEVTGTTVIPKVFTIYSTVGEMAMHEKGRAFVQAMIENSTGGSQAAQGKESLLGEGSEESSYNTMMMMPLISLVTYGRLTEQELDRLISELNA